VRLEILLLNNAELKKTTISSTVNVIQIEVLYILGLVYALLYKPFGAAKKYLFSQIE
jgi:hypothetical protein